MSSPYNITAQRYSARPENLALLYQGVLTAIVRVQSGRQPIADAASFRKRMRDILDQISREATRNGYEPHDSEDANYAVVAFLDEAVQNSADPSRNQWRSLQAEMYERAIAGEGFFERLTALRKRPDSPALADVLEVYYLCLLLGYKGQYAVLGDIELGRSMEEIGRRIRAARGSSTALSPSALQVTATPPPVTSKPVPAYMWIAGILLATVFVWTLLRILLYLQAQDVIEKLS